MKSQTGNLEQCRITDGPMGSDESYGFNGAFRIPNPKCPQEYFQVVCSDGAGWEHVSVVGMRWDRYSPRMLTWEEMCYVKSLFWEPEEAAMQLHPPESEYINNHHHCLHLWRPTDREIPLPDSFLVGVAAMKEKKS